MISRKFYIILFALLYICTAAVSTWHAISFFQLANNLLMGVVLAVTFEIGQAAVLFSILNSSKERSKFMPWCLMFILTAVQIMGNVFSSYKYIVTNSVNDIVYFKESILFFMQGYDDQMMNVILTYIIGAILPVVALCMTSMVTNYLEDNTSEPKTENYEEQSDEPDKTSDESDKKPEDTEMTHVEEHVKDADKLTDVIFR